VARLPAEHHLYIARAAALALPGLLVLGLMVHSPPRCPLAQRFHVPCPGCGLTRATRLLLADDLSASFHLQPLLVPLLLATVALGTGVIVATLRSGHPGGLVHGRVGRATLGFALLVTVATVVLWALRFAGLFGGPVAV
jgi:hypothetical protein